MAAAAGLEARLGHAFQDPRLLEQALTHSSYVNEHPDPPLIANERLEFLGDAVLSLVISEALWDRHPDDAEGVLTARRAAIVSARDLARIAARIDLGEYLQLGQGAERSGERARGSVLASTFEAVVAAVHLDGGLEAARQLVLRLCGPELDQPLAPVALKPPKSRLQELAYRRVGRPPSYRVLAVDGPAHDRRYEVDVVLDGAVLGTGRGRSRRDAETQAAAMALEQLAAATTTDEAAEAADAADAEGAARPDGAEPPPVAPSGSAGR
ncbi:MAG: ribonuclease III [Chloroflexota bacterium]